MHAKHRKWFTVLEVLCLRATALSHCFGIAGPSGYGVNILTVVSDHMSASTVSFTNSSRASMSDILWLCRTFIFLLHTFARKRVLIQPRS